MTPYSAQYSDGGTQYAILQPIDFISCGQRCITQAVRCIYDNLHHIYNTWASGFNCGGQTTTPYVCRPLCIPQSAQLHNVNWTKNRNKTLCRYKTLNGDFVVQRQKSLPDKVPPCSLCIRDRLVKLTGS